MGRFLLICLGGAIGTGARYLTALIAARWLGVSRQTFSYYVRRFGIGGNGVR